MKVRLHKDVNWLQRLVQRFAWSRVGMWVGSNFLHHLDQLAIKITKGKTSLSSVIAGVPIVILTTTGARTGRLRSVPLIALPDQDRFILVASSWGREKHPGWYYNLKKNPCATLSAPGWQKPFIAHLANDAESDVYWDKVTEIYPGYRVYRRLAKKRKIGLFILEPETGLSEALK